MKKTIIIVIVAVLLICGIVLLISLGNNKQQNTEGSTTSSESQTNNANPIVGSWKNNSYGSDYVYTFNADGTGKYDAAGNTMQFTYTTEGNKISILYTGNTAPFETEYNINGDVLNVKDSLGKDTLYNKVK